MTSSPLPNNTNNNNKNQNHITMQQTQGTAETVPVDDEFISEYQSKYLKRIGLTDLEIERLLNSNNHEPTMDRLERLLSQHLMTVPFENMDQHDHPAHGDDTPHIPRKTLQRLPSLDVTRSLEKIIDHRRGGFCFELNLAFHWLLSSLGYKSRLGLADVFCSNQPVPDHVIILVNNLMDNDVPVLVDVGFGDPCNVPLPIQCNVPPRQNVHGDLFEFKVDTRNDRFDTALYRTRYAPAANKEEKEEPMYRFCINDDLEMTSLEFKKGLEKVLTTSPMFTEKRICVLKNSQGHVTLGKDYIKWVEQGETVKQMELPTETDWRTALQEHFGITLTP